MGLSVSAHSWPELVAHSRPARGLTLAKTCGGSMTDWRLSWRGGCELAGGGKWRAKEGWTK